jgi:hypothetical protein
VANPFSVDVEDGAALGSALEIAAASNRLLSALVAASREAATRPILVSKTTEVPSSYPLRAIGDVEAVLINDEDLNMLHAYIQLYMMRKGRVRSTLGTVGERLIFRSFPQTLAFYIERVLAEPDDTLASYTVLGPDGLAQFAETFREDPEGVVERYFGTPRIERRRELAKVADIRLVSLEEDVEETDVSAEIDETVGDAPGTGIGLPAADEESDDTKPVVDYIIEYTAAHLSKVVARALRMYNERGLGAAAAELKVTKAPRKTLGSVVKFARVRFDKVAIIYDGFDNWGAIDPEMRQTIITSLTEMRWLLDGDAVFVFLLERGGVPELEEQFAGGTRLEWDFPWLQKMQKAGDELDMDAVHSWLDSAALSGQAPDLSALDVLAQGAQGSLTTFVAMASAAVEDAAERGVAKIDDAAVEAGRAAAMRESKE